MDSSSSTSQKIRNDHITFDSSINHFGIINESVLSLDLNQHQRSKFISSKDDGVENTDFNFDYNKCYNNTYQFQYGANNFSCEYENSYMLPTIPNQPYNTEHQVNYNFNDEKCLEQQNQSGKFIFLDFNRFSLVDIRNRL